jgi:hypothetical protein
MADSIDDSPISTPVVEETEKGAAADEKAVDIHDLEVAPGFVAEKDFEGHYKDVPLGEGIVPEETDKFIDPRLENYPIPEVAKTVNLMNDPT